MIGLLVWSIVIGLGAAAVVGGLCLLLREFKLGERREKWHDQTTGPAGSMFNALFLAAFALSVVIGWQAFDHARTNVQNEGSSLVALYDDVGGLPDGAQLQADVRDYTDVVVNKEWPLLSQGQSSPDADQRLRALSDKLLAIHLPPEGGQATQLEAIKELDSVRDERDSRLRDATTTLPWGLIVSLVIGAVITLGHGVLSGLPHTLPSLVPLMVEAALVAVAVYIIFVIRQPFHGGLDIGPDELRTALTRFTDRG